MPSSLLSENIGYIGVFVNPGRRWTSLDSAWCDS